jgi:excisionase family DNA binding protein
MENLYTIEETAKYLKISKPSLYRIMAEGKIVSIKLGGRTLFTEEELTRFVDTLKEEARVRRKADRGGQEEEPR